MKQPIIALIGNPNCGKTSLFNALTGAKQRVGNWPGVTVERKEGTYRHQGQSITVVDLPGVYSVSLIWVWAQFSWEELPMCCSKLMHRVG